MGTEQKQLVDNASASAPTQQYFAIDPITGINYKVDMSLSSEVGSASLVAMTMNETVFQETSGAIVPAPNAQIYQTDNGQVVYTTQPPPNATAMIPTIIRIQQPLTSSPSQSGKRGKKRGASVKQERGCGGGSPLNRNSPLISNTIPASMLSSVQSVDDLPRTRNDEAFIYSLYPCPICNKRFKGNVLLEAHHFQEHYKNPELNQVDIGDKHVCRVCLRLFARNCDVKAHIMRVHCRDRRYPCSICDKRFKESTHLKKHMHIHTGERNHFCSLCSKAFQTIYDLRRHKQTKVHQERVEQAGRIEMEGAESPPSAPVVVANKLLVRKPAPVAITTAGCNMAATSSTTNTSITSMDGSLLTTRWSDDLEMNEPENASSENASQVILNNITEPVVVIVGPADYASASGQLIVPTTTSATGGTITDAAKSSVHMGNMVSAASTSSTAALVNWSGSGSRNVTTNNTLSSSPSTSTPVVLKVLTSASDISGVIKSVMETTPSAAPSASDPGLAVQELDDMLTPDNVAVKMEMQSMDFGLVRHPALPSRSRKAKRKDTNQTKLLVSMH